MNRPRLSRRALLARLAALGVPALPFAGWAPLARAQNAEVQAQHAAIGVKAPPYDKPVPHTGHPDAQWFAQAGFGFFLHWGLSSVHQAQNPRVKDLSWPMIVGAWKNRTFTDPKEQERIVRERDWNFDGQPPAITPNDYWAGIKKFNPQKHDPDKWIRAAKEAGFTYAVLTTKHHEGFALWPSAYGDFNTRNHMGGRDLVQPFVDACRKHGLKVGLYYSPPDWYFNREFETFMYYGTVKLNPWMPEIDADLNVRTTRKTEEEKDRQLEAYNVLVKGQVEELLTRYGKIDLLWFDGRIPAPKDPKAPRLTQERIRELQPGVVLSPRYFWNGDYHTYEGPKLEAEHAPNGWAEWCTTWGPGWDYNPGANYANGYILGNLAKARSLNINMNLGVGPDQDGELNPNAYKDMAVVAGWMKRHKAAVLGAAALPQGETANVPATAAGPLRYLFATPRYRKEVTPLDSDLLPPDDATLTLHGLAAAPKSVLLMADGQPVASAFAAGSLTVQLPRARRSALPDVVQVTLA